MRAYPNEQQRRALTVAFGQSRWIYNMALDACSFAYRNLQQRYTPVDCSRAFTELKRDSEYDWLNDVPKTVHTQSLRNLTDAFTRFFKGEGRYPRFKSRKDHEQVANCQLDLRQNNWLPGKLLKVPGLGALKVRWTREFKGRPTKVTIRMLSSGEYHASVQTEEIIDVLPFTGRTTGSDVGLKDAAVTVTDQGEVFHSGAPRHYYKLARLLRILDRRLARKAKGSGRREKMRRRRARVHELIARCRADFAHKLSHFLVWLSDRIAIEDLNIKGMLRNKRLAKAIADAGLGELHRQIVYKAAWHLRELPKCDRWFASSKTCSVCGHVHKELKLSERKWTCAQCGTVHERDANAGVNVLRSCFPETRMKHPYRACAIMLVGLLQSALVVSNDAISFNGILWTQIAYAVFYGTNSTASQSPFNY